VTFGAKRVTVTWYSSEFSLHYSVNEFQYSRGVCHGSELFTIEKRRCESGRIAQSVEPRYGIPMVPGSSNGQAAHFSHPVI
jgi:hypothetical protein